MKTQYPKMCDQLIKGVVLGVLFSTEIFESRFRSEFEARLNGFEPPLKAIVLLKVAELFTGDDEVKMEQIFDWVNENFHRIFKNVHVESIVRFMNEVEYNSDLTRMN